jgi:uncharacterized protein (TIGR02611 family)
VAAGDKSMIDRVRERKERHKQRSRIYRALWVLLGSLVIVGGLALSLPGIPGPGLLLLAVGLAMLALEFDRAERLLERLLVRLERLSDRAASASGTQKIAVGVVAVAVVAAGVMLVVIWGIPFVPDEAAR